MYCWGFCSTENAKIKYGSGVTLFENQKLDTAGE